MEKPQHHIRIHPGKTALTLLGISLLILIFSLLGQREYYADKPTVKFFRELFTEEFFVNNGENIATYWNMLTLIMVSALGFIIAAIKQAQKDAHRRLWWGFTFLFLYFAVDSLAGVTRRMIALLKNLPNLEDGAVYGWFYPLAIGIAVLLLCFFIVFYIRLDAPNKFILPLSLLLYIAGEYRANLFNDYYADLYGKTSTTYMLITHVLELAQYTGIILMIYLLLTYLGRQISKVEFTSS